MNTITLRMALNLDVPISFIQPSHLKDQGAYLLSKIALFQKPQILSKKSNIKDKTTLSYIDVDQLLLSGFDLQIKHILLKEDRELATLTGRLTGLSGIIGQDILNQFVLEIDSELKEIRFYSRSAYPAYPWTEVIKELQELKLLEQILIKHVKKNNFDFFEMLVFGKQQYNFYDWLEKTNFHDSNHVLIIDLSRLVVLDVPRRKLLPL